MLTAGEFCNREVTIGSPDDRVCELARCMRDYHVGSVVIVEERHDGRAPIGILTDRDIVVNLLAVDPGRVESALARELLSGHLVVAREEETLDEVIARMRTEGVRRIPVIDRVGILQGIIAFDDLVEHFADEMVELATLLESEQKHERDRLESSGDTSPRLEH